MGDQGEAKRLKMDKSIEQAMSQGVFWITPQLAIGQFASEKRAQLLREQGVTHILNVSDAPSVVSVESGFSQVVDVLIEDNVPIPHESARRCIEFVDLAIKDFAAKVYIHCTAGQNRSPTIAWLYLISTGMDERRARELISAKCPDAIPGHKLLVNEELIRALSYR